MNKTWVFVSLACLTMCFSVLETQAQSLPNRPDLGIPEMVGESRSYIAAFFGGSFPTEQFSSLKQRENSGFAKTGIKINVDGAYVFTRNIGIGGTMGHFTNAVDVSSYFEQFGVQITGNESDYLSGLWKNTYMAVGPYFSLPEKKLFFEGRLLFGAAYTQTPSLRLSIDQRIERPANEAISFATVFGLGIGYRIAKQWKMMFQTEFMMANPHLEVTHYINEGGLSIEAKNEYTQRIVQLSASIGLSLDLTK